MLALSFAESDMLYFLMQIILLFVREVVQMMLER
jgi:hypothetical protein